MFTVVICSDKFLSDTKNNYSHIVEALSNQKDCAVCVWNTQADSFDKALPDLKKIVFGKGAWRAVVIQDGITFGTECIDKCNPFDAVGAVNVIQDFGEIQILDKLDEYLAVQKAGKKIDDALWQEMDEEIKEAENRIKAYRKKKIDNYNTAVCNPLTRLGIWLFGITDKQAPRKLEKLPDELYDDSRSIDRKYFLSLLEERVFASEIEQYHIFNYKNNALTSNFKSGSMLQTVPENILVISERTKIHSEDSFFSSGLEFEEIEYSNFCDDNLYSNRMRFVFFDVNYENEKRNAKDYLAFLTSLLAFAENVVPGGSIRPERVYKCEANINEKKVVQFYNRYLSKLYKTRDLLLSMHQRRIYENQKQDVTSKEAIESFESDVNIPVEIEAEYQKSDLMAEYDKIGLSKDCPIEEYDYWYNQVCEITKKFIRYLREPRRALKKSVKKDFHLKNTISNERAKNLNEFQAEDIQYHLAEEERKMVETTTTAIFQTKKFTDELDKADKEIRKGISQRMTKKKTLIVGAIAGLAYLFGFFPLVFGNLNTTKSFVFSLSVTGIVLGLFLIVGFIYLIILRKRLINRFKHFNYVMSGVLSDIDDALQAFSRYLSHACNVMREFSVLNWLKGKEDAKLNVIKKHIRDIEIKIKDTEEMFICDYSQRFVSDEDIQPYSYDFAVARDYPYDIPCEDVDVDMEFIIKGNIVNAPVEYVESITLTREELYD